MEINKNIYFERAFNAKRDFKEYAMRKNKQILGNREEYVKYFLNVWSSKPENRIKGIDLCSELAAYHLFCSERTFYRILKNINKEKLLTPCPKHE